MNFEKPSPKSVWVKLRSAARVGKSATIDANRYDGDPIGSTERVRVSLPPVQLGMLLDKDRYEPSVADLSRFYGAWRSGSATIIAGDFHIGSLDGVTLATKPMLLNGFDGPAGFSKSRQLLEPGLDGIQNSALRGVAGGIEWNGFDLEAFVSRTDLDGIHTMAKKTTKKKATKSASAAGKSKARSSRQPVKASAAVPAPIFVLKVALEGDKSVWRRIAFRGDQTLDDVHEAVYRAFDRYDEHLYSF